MSAKKRFILILSFSVRKIIPIIDKMAPKLAERARSSGWIWQPTKTHGTLDKWYNNTIDPWQFDSNPYERSKYEYTLHLLNGRVYSRALEVGSAEGVFTELLSPLCEKLIAMDVSSAAVERARERLSRTENVSVIKASLPHEMPEGKFDLIVVSDVLYYFPKDVLIALIGQLAARLKLGGVLFALHYLGDIKMPVSGYDVHELLKQHMPFEVTHNETVSTTGQKEAGYTITIFQNVGHNRNSANE
jgi:SAM-dependent methyltransferase